MVVGVSFWLMKDIVTPYTGSSGYISLEYLCSCKVYFQFFTGFLTKVFKQLKMTVCAKFAVSPALLLIPLPKRCPVTTNNRVHLHGREKWLNFLKAALGFLYIKIWPTAKETRHGKKLSCNRKCVIHGGFYSSEKLGRCLLHSGAFVIFR